MSISRRSHYLAQLVRLLVVASIAAVFCANGPARVSAQSNAITYRNPLAYISVDGNYYVTSLDGTSVTKVTSNMAVRQGEGDDPTHYDSAPHWLPEGTGFAFNDGDATLFVVKSRMVPVRLVSTAYLGNDEFTLSPDGERIALVDGSFPRYKLEIVSSSGTAIRRIELPMMSDNRPKLPCVGDGPAPEHAWRMLDEDRDGPSGTQRLYWVSQGFLFVDECLYHGTALISDTGILLKTLRSLEDMIVSPDNTRLLGHEITQSSNGQDLTVQPYMLDVANGDELPMPVGLGAEPLAWTNDSKTIIFGTQTLHKKFVPPDKPTDYITYPGPEHDDYILTMWRQGLDEKRPTKLFEHEGYDFGRVTVAPDDSAVVFSLISNSYFDKVDPEVQIVAVPMNGGQPEWIAVGGKPAFGKGPFTAIPAVPDVPVQPTKCPESLVSRLTVGQRAKVTPGEPNSLRSAPASGPGLRTMFAESRFLVLDGPKCGADGLAWWKVNYQGVVGWTAESDSKSYWLEP